MVGKELPEGFLFRGFVPGGVRVQQRGNFQILAGENRAVVDDLAGATRRHERYSVV